MAESGSKVMAIDSHDWLDLPNQRQLGLGWSSGVWPVLTQ